MIKMDRRKFSLLGSLGLIGAALRSSLARGQSTSKNNARSTNTATQTSQTASPSKPPTDSQNGPSSSDQACGDLKDYKNAITWSEDKINYWVGGFSYKTPGLNSRASLAILLKEPQTNATYIDKVVLTTADSAIVAASYFSATDKISTGYLPYLIYNNLSFSSAKYFLYIQQQASGQIQRYRYTFTQSSLTRSTLNGIQLPAKVRGELNMDPLFGTISSLFSYPEKVDMSKHIVQAQFVFLSKNNAFSIKIKSMHKDVSINHYMRYFIVTDPVGRILGLHRRNPGELDDCIISNLTEADRNTWGLTQDKVGKINDCPYVMIFCDDVQEVIAMTTLWLR